MLSINMTDAKALQWGNAIFAHQTPILPTPALAGFFVQKGIPDRTPLTPTHADSTIMRRAATAPVNFCISAPHAMGITQPANAQTLINHFRPLPENVPTPIKVDILQQELLHYDN